MSVIILDEKAAHRSRNYRKLSSAVANGHRAEAGRHVCLFDEFIKRPCLENRFAAQVLLQNRMRIGNRAEPSVLTYRDRDEDTGPFNLAHVGDLAGIVGLKLVDHLPVLAEYADGPIAGSEKQAVGAGADAGDIVAFEESGGLGLGKRHLGDVKEVKRLPLEKVSLSAVVSAWLLLRAGFTAMPYRDGHVVAWNGIVMLEPWRSLLTRNDDGGTMPARQLG